MKKILLFAAGVICVASCTKELGNEVNITEQMVISASLERQDAGKSSLNENDGCVYWSTGDKVSILSSVATSGEFATLLSGEGTTQGQFGGNITAAENYYAVYPYSASNCLDGTNIKFKMPQEQVYSADSFGNGANVELASFTQSGIGSVQFHNVGSVLKLTLTNASGITKIAIQDNAGNSLWGDCTVPISSIGSDMTVSNGTNTVFLTGISGVTDAATDFYITVPAGVFTKGFTAYIYNASGVITSFVSTHAENTVSRSKILYLDAVSAEAPVNRDLSSGAAGHGTRTANCYIVPCGGSYRFKSVQGNGTNAVEPASVDVLWETFCTTDAPTANDLIKSVSYDSGYIKFTTADSYKSGNALIVAKDASSNILWSWHIWMVDEPVQTIIYPSGARFMDRNLGALSANKDAGSTSFGLLYQWGRKDPFMACVVIPQSTAMASTYDFASNQVNVKDNPGTYGTLDYVITHPATFIACTDGYNSNNWYYVGGTEPQTQATANTLWNPTAKTIYDPSPAGYKVPANGAFTGLSTTNCTVYGANNTASYGRVYKQGDLEVWYPFTGYRWRKDGSIYGAHSAEGVMQTASSSGAHFYSCNMNADYFYPSNNKYDLRANAQLVRCVSE